MGGDGGGMRVWAVWGEEGRGGLEEKGRLVRNWCAQCNPVSAVLAAQTGGLVGRTARRTAQAWGWE